MNLRRAISLWIGGFVMGMGTVLTAINIMFHNPSQAVAAGIAAVLCGLMLTLMGALLK